MNEAMRYRASDGTLLTAEQVEQDFKKARIVAGTSTSGEDYDVTLRAWRDTYEEVPPLTIGQEMRNGGAALIALVVCIALTAVVTLVSAIGGGILAGVLVFVVGTLMSLGVAGFVMMVTFKPSAS